MSPTNCPNRFIGSEVKFLNRNRPLAYTMKEDDDDDETFLIMADPLHQYYVL